MSLHSPILPLIDLSICLSTAQDPPFAIDLFEDYIYVLTHKTSEVMKVHKFDFTPTPLFFTLEHALDLIIVQDKKQPIGKRTWLIFLLVFWIAEIFF